MLAGDGSLKMKFVVQLKGVARVLESIAPCFQGEGVRIVRRDDDWFLESSKFDAFANGGEVFPIADELLRLIQRVSYLYTRLLSPLEIGYVQPFSETGTPLRRALRASATLNVISAAGIEELQNSRGSQTLGAEIVDRAMTDEPVRAAMSLVGEGDLKWPQIYDVIEFLGVETVVENEWATRKEVTRVRQTANYYRHLGSPRENLLPLDRPSLSDSRSFVIELLRKWISDQIKIR
jgi:hypothetical protein